MNKSSESEPGSPELQQVAADQMALEKTLQSLSEKLKEIAKGSPFYSSKVGKLMQQAKESMSQSSEALMDRNATNAARNQQDAMFSLNQAANQLMQSMQSQKQCTGGQCNNENLFKKMNKLCNSQKQINQQSSSVCDKPSQGRADRQEMGRLAAEQNAIHKSLAEMQKEQGNRKEILGRLDELGKEVKKVVEDYEGGTADQNTLKRQHQIYNRMLDFQRSLERQDFSEERKAQVAEDIIRNSPPPLMLGSPDGKNSYQDRLQKYMNEGYPPEYEELIKEYFRTVNGNPQK